jgi:hypothetical protein
LNNIELLQERLVQSIQDLKSSGDLVREEKKFRFLSQAEKYLQDPQGIEKIYELLPQIIEAGLFKESIWESPKSLIPRLVGGTLKAGTPTSNFELLSELRMLAIAEGRLRNDEMGPVEAESFLEEVIVLNLKVVFGAVNESDRVEFSKGELKKIRNVFEFIIQHVEIDGVKDGIAEELRLVAQQRPIFTEPIRSLIRLTHEYFQFDLSREADITLQEFSDAIYGPTQKSSQLSPSEYKSFLAESPEEVLESECATLAQSMKKTGLVCKSHVALLQHLAEKETRTLMSVALDLSEYGSIELQRHWDFVLTYVKNHSTIHYAQGVLGLSNVLKKGLFTSSSVLHALRHLINIRLNPRVQRHIAHSRVEGTEADSHNMLIGGTLSLLGNPLGVGQGMNPTCQSARGLSLWSQFSPEKLINLIITASVENNLRFRFEGDVLESDLLLKGLATQFDSSLDPVSVVLVPHLDKIYNEMMKRASYRGEDPHKWVNPSFYGHWIPNGFASAYNYMTQSIHQYPNFVKTFYAAFHPKYNNGKQIIYPVPTGLFITNSRAEMLGFHAVSILRVARDSEGVMRIYFLNPNNEGRQNWGQGILPTVYGHGEKAGESSLPFEQFVARSYAIHFHRTGIEERMQHVPPEVVNTVVEMAKSSWGEKYIWT